MSGLSKKPVRKRGGPKEADLTSTDQPSSGGRTAPGTSRKPEASADLVTTDLGGLGPRLSDPDAPWTWHYRITRQSSQVASGFSNATTYPDARAAAKGVLTDYIQAAKVPVGIRRIYACSVVQIGDDENIGAAAGKDVR